MQKQFPKLINTVWHQREGAEQHSSFIHSFVSRENAILENRDITAAIYYRAEEMKWVEIGNWTEQLLQLVFQIKQKVIKLIDLGRKKKDKEKKEKK